MTIEKDSPCKVNLLLNILGKREDGFHEIESLMHPVRLCDRLGFERGGTALAMTCSLPGLPADSTNLVWRAADLFLKEARISEGVRIHLEKHIPLAAGLGGGSGNAATTLLALNELFGDPLGAGVLARLAASLGSDVPFFLQSRPALVAGRGEQVEPIEPFPALRGLALLLVHPGFGISTAWAYRALAGFPDALHGQSGRARQLASLLRVGDLERAGAAFYNSLEAPALHKYPVLAVYQQFLRENGALAALMSGSGSTTFALVRSVAAGEDLAGRFRQKFGKAGWLAVAPL